MPRTRSWREHSPCGVLSLLASSITRVTTHYTRPVRRLPASPPYHLTASRTRYPISPGHETACRPRFVRRFHLLWLRTCGLALVRSCAHSCGPHLPLYLQFVFFWSMGWCRQHIGEQHLLLVLLFGRVLPLTCTRYICRHRTHSPHST